MRWCSIIGEILAERNLKRGFNKAQRVMKRIAAVPIELNATILCLSKVSCLTRESETIRSFKRSRSLAQRSIRCINSAEMRDYSSANSLSGPGTTSDIHCSMSRRQGGVEHLIVDFSEAASAIAGWSNSQTSAMKSSVSTSSICCTPRLNVLCCWAVGYKTMLSLVIRQRRS